MGGVVSLFVGLVISRIVAATTSPGVLKAPGIAAVVIIGAGCLATLWARLTADVSPPLPSPPPPTKAEVEAQRDAREQAEFDAIAPDASITAWFPHVRHALSETRRAAAIKAIMSRPGFAVELGSLMVADHASTAAEAMLVVAELPDPPAELIASVAAAGQDIIGRIRKVNATPKDDDPAYEAAADVSIRFSAWIGAARLLREKGAGDFVPELRTILELSRVRTDSNAMQRDVRRVASYYAHKWAGIAPLPDDPPPM